MDEPLNAVVADLELYSDRRIVIATPVLGNLRVTGIVYVRNIDGWLTSLEASLPLRVTLEGDGTATIEQR